MTTLMGLVLVSVVAVGIRLVFMQTIQRRRERENRQINERLRTLIAAYKVLGGAFTGELAVDPTRRRDQRRTSLPVQEPLDAALLPSAMPEQGADNALADTAAALDDGPPESVAERRRRIRDAVEAALSDVILLGTEEQVRLAAHAASEMVAGRKVELAALVVSLRTFVREALDLDPIPADVLLPAQGPLRPAALAGRSGGGAGRGAGGQGGQGQGRGQGGRGGGGGGGGAGMGMGLGMGAGGLGGSVAAHRASDGSAAPEEDAAGGR